MQPHSLQSPPVACYALSRSALPLARQLAVCLGARPWPRPDGTHADRAVIFAPRRFCPPDGRPFDRLGELLAQTFNASAAHVFIGAAGIAVRALAPLLVHKSADPPVLVLDPAGRHAVSLLSGHWGGGNSLTRHVARLLGATPVITTASDTAEQGSASGHGPALDLLLRDAGLRIVDWDRLPRAQAALLEGRKLRIWDPCAALPPHALLEPLALSPFMDDGAPEHTGHKSRHEKPGKAPSRGNLPEAAPHAPPLPVIHWRRLPGLPGLLRIAAPRLTLGLGCRKDLPPRDALDALDALLAARGLEPLAVAALATVTEKLAEPALRAAARHLNVPLRAYSAAELAACRVPHPSAAAGRRFGQPPFSVCEGAALLAARDLAAAAPCRAPGPAATLLLPKRIEDARLTVAVALFTPNRTHP